MPEEIDSQRLRQLLEENAMVIDVRGEDAYAEKHLADAVNIPFDGFAARLPECELQAPVVVVCQKGKRSMAAARLLEGYEEVDSSAGIYSLQDGYDGLDGGFEME